MYFLKIFVVVLYILFGVAVVSSPGHAQGNEDISVNFDEKNQSFAIKHCFMKAPDYFVAKENQIIALTSNMQWQSKPIRFKRGYAQLPEGDKGCLSYTIGTQKSNSRRLKQHPDHVLVKIDHLLWQANDQHKRVLPKVTISHNENAQVSSPWDLISRSQIETVYQMKPTPRYSDGYVAFGPMELQTIRLGDSELRLAIMYGSYQQKSKLITEWIKAMAGSVAQVADNFPLKDIQVLVILIDGKRGVVPWGQVNRAGGAGVLFVVNANKSKEQLFSDWTAAHEFSHLLTPYTPNDRWLSEGFASYHQNISRLRSGLLDEGTAWSKLLAGFERGQKSASKKNAPKLKESNRRNNMQMYWGGAVIALQADVALQQATAGKMSLSQALAGLHECCLESRKDWSAEQLFLELDRISGTQVFSNIYHQEVMKNSYPEYKSLLESLGIKKNHYGEVLLSDEAPMADIRKRISKG